MTKRRMPLRAIAYRRDGDVYTRCSRCQRERKDTSLLLPESQAQSDLIPIMVGQDLCGLLCSDCFTPVCRHIASIFPDGYGFPFVDEQQQLQPTPRCDDCGTVIHYSEDGRSVVCDQCDTLQATPPVDPFFNPLDSL